VYRLFAIRVLLQISYLWNDSPPIIMWVTDSANEAADKIMTVYN
jgi:hypothetical protein